MKKFHSQKNNWKKKNQQINELTQKLNNQMHESSSTLDKKKEADKVNKLLSLLIEKQKQQISELQMNSEFQQQQGSQSLQTLQTIDPNNHNTSSLTQILIDSHSDQQDQQYQIKQLPISLQSIKQIFESAHFTDEQKSEQLNNIYLQCKQTDNTNLLISFDKQILQTFKAYLGSCSTAPELALLSILQYVVECLTSMNETENEFRSGIISYKISVQQNMKESGLKKMIEDLFNTVVTEYIKNENKQMPKAAEKIVLLYLMIMKDKSICIKDEYLKISLDIIQNQITKLFNKLIKEEQALQKGSLLTLINENSEQIELSAKLIKSLDGQSEKYAFTNSCPIQWDDFLNKVDYLIDICKKIGLYYSRCSNQSERSASQELLLAIYELMKEFICSFDNINYHIRQHKDIGNILTPHINISSTQSLSINQSQLNFQSYPVILTSQKVVMEALHVLKFLLSIQTWCMKSSYSMHTLVPALIKLVALKKQDHRMFNEKCEDKDYSERIRSTSQLILERIMSYNDKEVCEQLKNTEFSSALCPLVDSEQNSEIEFALESFKVILRYINYQREIKSEALNNRNIILRQFESIEEFGGNEDIDAHLMKNEEDKYYKIKQKALDVKNELIIYYQYHQSAKKHKKM